MSSIISKILPVGGVNLRAHNSGVGAGHIAFIYGIIPTMDKRDASNTRNQAKAKLWPWLFVAILGWMVFCPSYLGEYVACKALTAVLNDDQAGLSCQRVDLRFSYWELLLHTRLRHLKIEGLAIDLSGKLQGGATNLVANRSAKIDFQLDALPDRSRHTMKAELRGRVLDWPLFGEITLDENRERWFSLLGQADLALKEFPSEETAWRCKADFTASPGAWEAHARTDDLRFRSNDEVLGSILPRLQLAAFGPPDLSGSLAFAVDAEKPKARAYPTWSATARLQDVNASFATTGRTFAVKSLSVRAAAAGIADHVDLHPISLRAAAIDAAGIPVTNLYATLVKTDRHFLVTEAGAGFCGGAARLYALSLDPNRLNAGFTLFLDDIETSELLNHLPGFHGEASGRLHGKLPLFIRNGRELRLKDAYLYSTPGEIGKLRLDDASALTDNLAAAGVDDATRQNLAKAMADLDYKTLKLRLTRVNEDELALALKLEGSATAHAVTVPVSFEVTFHGELEQLVNFGLRAATKKDKDKQ